MAAGVMGVLSVMVFNQGEGRVSGPAPNWRKVTYPRDSKGRFFAKRVKLAGREGPTTGRKGELPPEGTDTPVMMGEV